jgi:hypothetical protein
MYARVAGGIPVQPKMYETPVYLTLIILCVTIVDKVLESCFQLLSLFFMTIGRTSEAPAAYALTSTIKRILDHLAEAGLFSAKDLDSMSQTLNKLYSIMKNADAKHSPYLIELLTKRVDRCKVTLQRLQKTLDTLEEPLPAIHEKLISILRSMALANTKAKVGYEPLQKHTHHNRG